MNEAPGSPRIFAASGAFGCAIAVALSAFAMHANVSPHDRERLAIAALFLFCHALALVVLAASAGSRLRQVALGVLAVGTVLFSGSLVCAAVFGIEPRLAPMGGSATILGWLLLAAALLRG